MNRNLAGALAILVVVLLAGVLILATQRPVAAPSPSPSPTTAATATITATTGPTTAATTTTPPGPTSEFCQNTYQPGDPPPVVAPRKSGRFAEVALDSVRLGPSRFGNATRWNIRAFNPTGSGGTFEMPLRATVRTSAGATVAVLGYEVGPPNAGTNEARETVVIFPCDPNAVPGTPQRGKVVLIVHTAPITSGTYTLTLSDVKLPEGGTRTETWTVTLTCGAPDPGNPAGTRCQ